MNILENFNVKKGSHCASTSLSEIMQYNNINLSEAMVFGISSGLDFVYMNQSYMDFSRLVFTRTPMLEVDFFNNIGVEFLWENNTPPSYEDIINSIDSGCPLLFLTDPSVLDFFEVTIPSAAGHTLTVIGYDKNNNSVLISDSISSDVYFCDYKNLCNSINVGKPPFYIKNVWASVKAIENNINLEEVIMRGLKNNAENMLNQEHTNRGIVAIDKLCKEVPYWYDLPNYRDLCSHVYHSIENIGTGGSGFRNLYKQFLGEISNHTNKIDASFFVDEMTDIALLYKKLSKTFYLESSHKEKSHIHEIENILRRISESECTFWNSVLKEVK